ncbi:hypothetical protein [Nocardia gipuzkoensis]
MKRIRSRTSRASVDCGARGTASSGSAGGLATTGSAGSGSAGGKLLCAATGSAIAILGNAHLGCDMLP